MDARVGAPVQRRLRAWRARQVGHADQVSAAVVAYAADAGTEAVSAERALQARWLEDQVVHHG